MSLSLAIKKNYALKDEWMGEKVFLFHQLTKQYFKL